MNAPTARLSTNADWRISRLDLTDSTNQQLLEAAEKGSAKPGDVLIADQQSAGRGRQGRQWLSPVGGLYFSALIEDREGWGPIWALVVGLAAHQAIGNLLGREAHELKLKWPNDLMLTDRKLGGILIERAGERQPWWLVMGIGINVHVSEQREPDIAYLQDIAPDVTADILAERLLEAISALRKVFAQGGKAMIRKAWLDYAWRLGGPVSCHVDGGKLHGTFRDLDGDGALLLELADGTTRKISGGVVHFGTEQEAG